MSCTGNGRCMKRCTCKSICSCLDIGHEHISFGIHSFCKVECRHNCKPTQCSTQWCKEIVTTNQSTCNTCNIFKIEFTTVQEECCICYKKKYMIETQCKHRYCFDCLMDDQAEVVACFLCRRPLEFNPI
jgi:hypothetical protein